MASQVALLASTGSGASSLPSKAIESIRAEQVGRTSMHECERTVSVFKRDHARAGVPGASQSLLVHQRSTNVHAYPPPKRAVLRSAMRPQGPMLYSHWVAQWQLEQHKQTEQQRQWQQQRQQWQPVHSTSGAAAGDDAAPVVGALCSTGRGSESDATTVWEDGAPRARNSDNAPGRIQRSKVGCQAVQMWIVRVM